MNSEEKKAFLNNVWHFYFEKGDVTRLIGFSTDKLSQASPRLAIAYSAMIESEKEFARILNEETEDE